jgi:hypothetical protein
MCEEAIGYLPEFYLLPLRLPAPFVGRGEIFNWRHHRKTAAPMPHASLRNRVPARSQSGVR